MVYVFSEKKSKRTEITILRTLFLETEEESNNKIPTRLLVPRSVVRG